MPNIKSASKRVEISAKYALQNRANRSNVKTMIKRFEAAVEAHSPEAETLLRQAASAIDKAASKGAFHKNTANRKKAQLARRLRSAQ